MTITCLCCFCDLMCDRGMLVTGLFVFVTGLSVCDRCMFVFVCSRFRELQADAVFAFQLRNPIHNGHALLMQVGPPPPCQDTSPSLLPPVRTPPPPSSTVLTPRMGRHRTQDGVNRTALITVYSLFNVDVLSEKTIC